MSFDKVVWRHLHVLIEERRAKEFGEIIGQHPELVNGGVGRGNLLHHAACLGNCDAALELLRLGSDVNFVKDFLGSPLDCAAQSGHIQTARLLLDHGATLVGKSTTPLLSAIYGDQPEMVKFLIDSGTDPHLVYTLADGSPINALGYARMYGRPTIGCLGPSPNTLCVPSWLLPSWLPFKETDFGTVVQHRGRSKPPASSQDTSDTYSFSESISGGVAQTLVYTKPATGNSIMVPYQGTTTTVAPGGEVYTIVAKQSFVADDKHSYGTPSTDARRIIGTLASDELCRVQCCKSSIA